MCPRAKFKDFYTDEELKIIHEAWLRDKARIDEDSVRFGYYYDRDEEYKRCLNNKNLQKLFGHAAFLKRRAGIEGEIPLHKRMEDLVNKVYGEVIKYGYYSKSKKEEKRVRNIFAKIISGYHYRRYKQR